jgi:hypothetical protein
MNKKESSKLQDFKVNIRVRLAALWTSVTFCYLYGDYFELYTPGKVEGLFSGDHGMGSPVFLFIASVVMAIPPLMIFLSLVLRPIVAKWFNIASGMLFTVMMVLIAVVSLTPWYIFYVFLALVEATLTSMIVWNAIYWPKQREEVQQTNASELTIE